MVQKRADQTAMKLSGIALMLWSGAEAGNVSPVVSGVVGEMESNSILLAAEETGARIDLFLHWRFSGRPELGATAFRH